MKGIFSMLKRTGLALLIGAGALITLGPASAQDEPMDINPWQHCGIGAAIFDENETASAISNVIWDSGTTAITSATASPDTCSSTQIDVASYIDLTNDALTAELAMGSGDHLSGLLAMAGCDARAGMVTAEMRESVANLPEDYGQLSHADQAHYTYQALEAAGWQDSTCN
jgi:hypothetical protein